jgi:hypothetical protein
MKKEVDQADKIKEVIRFRTERLKILMALFGLPFGGFLSLLVEGPNGRQVIFCIWGLLGAVLLGFFAYKTDYQIRKLIEKL